MIYVTKHAVERYIERVMEVDASKDEIEDMVNELGGFISQNINRMISERDVGFSFNEKEDEEVYHIIYRNICIIVKNARAKDKNIAVVTLYKIETDKFLSDKQKYEYINNIIEIIKKIQEEIAKIKFKNDKADTVEAWRNRIKQYSQLLFQNPLHDQ